MDRWYWRDKHLVDENYKQNELWANLQAVAKIKAIFKSNRASQNGTVQPADSIIHLTRTYWGAAVTQTLWQAREYSSEQQDRQVPLETTC